MAQRDAKGRLLPSRGSLNPGGGPGRLRGKGLVEFIGKSTRDGLEIAEYFLRVLRGHEAGATPSDKRAAAEWLANRYMGKAVDVTMVGTLGDENNPLADMPAEELRSLIRVARTLPTDQPSTLPDVDRNIALPPPSAVVVDVSLVAVNGPPSDERAPDVSPQPPAPAPPINAYNASDVTSTAQKCPECGNRRAHNLDCSLRPKPTT